FDWPTAAGSRLWAQSIARRDATVVERLRQSGAVFVGKPVTTQYASFDPPPTRNPWKLERTPGGSSSGSAAAVACGMCLGALGWPRGLFQDLAEPPVQKMMDDISVRFAVQGAVVKDAALPAAFGDVLACHRTVMAVEAARFHARRLRRHPDDYKPNIRQLLEE